MPSTRTRTSKEHIRPWVIRHTHRIEGAWLGELVGPDAEQARISFPAAAAFGDGGVEPATLKPTPDLLAEVTCMVAGAPATIRFTHEVQEDFFAVETAASGGHSYRLTLRVLDFLVEIVTEEVGGEPTDHAAALFSPPWRVTVEALLAGDEAALLRSPLLEAAAWLISTDVLAVDTEVGFGDITSPHGERGEDGRLILRCPPGTTETLTITAEQTTWTLTPAGEHIEASGAPDKTVELLCTTYEEAFRIFRGTTDAHGRCHVDLPIATDCRKTLRLLSPTSPASAPTVDVVLRYGRPEEARLDRSDWTWTPLPAPLDGDTLSAWLAHNLRRSYDSDLHRFRRWTAQDVLDGHTAARGTKGATAEETSHLLGLVAEPFSVAAADSTGATALFRTLMTTTPPTFISPRETHATHWDRSLVRHVMKHPMRRDPVEDLLQRMTASLLPHHYAFSKARLGWEPDPDSIVTRAWAAVALVRVHDAKLRERARPTVDALVDGIVAACRGSDGPIQDSDGASPRPHCPDETPTVSMRDVSHVCQALSMAGRESERRALLDGAIHDLETGSERPLLDWFWLLRAFRPRFLWVEH